MLPTPQQLDLKRADPAGAVHSPALRSPQRKASPVTASEPAKPAQHPDHDEPHRLAALARLDVLDTLPEPLFDAITAAARQACQVPIALVSLVDAERQWFKSNIGLPGVQQTPREVAFCDHAIRSDSVLEVPDTRLDERFASNPMVTGKPGIRFYAGAPIVMPDGSRVGTVCVIDHQPRQLSEEQRLFLQSLALITSVALTDRRQQLTIGHALADSEARYRAIVEDQTELISLARPDGTLCFVNAAYARHFEQTPTQMVGRNLLDFVDPADRAAVAAHVAAACAAQQPLTGVNRSQSAAGVARWVAWTNRPIRSAQGPVLMLQSVGRDITDQHLAETRLGDALREKETLLKEVYHRVKNNLQVVQSLLNLQQRHVADGAARSALQECARRIRAMALVHEKLYLSGNLADLSLRDYTQDLLRLVDELTGASQRRVVLRAEVDDFRCRLESAIPYGLLVTELVCNALEHGFGDRPEGEVCVQLLRQGEAACLTVRDDGIGLTAGFDLSLAATMGLQLAVTLALQLGGQLEARSEGGAVFSVVLTRL